ncbi:MAG: glycosyltransferase [Proteobacteria bacterium]|nr:MAG: glycosyltransferase [Pseudomonadota bacterium]
MTRQKRTASDVQSACAGSAASTTLCLTMIVKDEAQVIARCLSSVAPFIDYWVVVDTGSTDDTIAIVRERLADIPGTIVERPWVNFGHNRNEALELAKGKAEFLLTIDADEVLEFEQDFRWPVLDADLYAIRTHVGSYTFARGYLMRSSLPWRYEGVLHERPVCAGHRVATRWLEGVDVMSYGDGGRSHLPNRFETEVSTLESALVDEPDNRSYRFFLANALVNLGELERAMSLYHEFTDQGRNDYAAWFAHYQTGIIKERLEKPWTECQQSYQEAFDLDPTRAEPLYRLIRAARLRGDYATGMSLGEIAVNIPTPRVFEPVDNAIYDFLLPSEYAICCQESGYPERATKIYDDLLTRPDLPSQVRILVENNRRLAVAAN